MSTSSQEKLNNTRQEALTLAKFLRHHYSLKNRVGILDGKRVDFFKVKYALRILETKSKNPNLLLSLLIQHKLIRRVDKCSTRIDGRRRLHRLRISDEQNIIDKAYFVWLYDNIPLTTVLIGIAALILVLTIILYPLWPIGLRRAVHRFSWAILALVILLIIISILRFFFFIITLFIFPPGIWIFPNLYEDVGFIDSFRPIWDWHKEKRKNKHHKSMNQKNSIPVSTINN
ncbi:hypothetical protein PCANB_002439 [Pneumocystis canis]|nr:hypothetical protein PCK1_002452 [Pneumocystis canis]KAG5438719.1 hypothetical protein PCANB_002439 [Pneumocystis canis]